MNSFIKYVEPILKVKKNSNIAIIGNSSNLLNSNNGSIIDSYDFIVRFNNFKIKKFEKDVGKKTDLVISNNTSYKKLKKLNNNILLIDPSMKIKISHIKKKYYFDYEKSLLLRYKYGPFVNFFDKSSIHGDWLNLILGQNFSSGLLVVLIFVESGFKPNLFGFNNSNTKMFHYFS